MKLLDCTLRDGGYYNDWDFSRALVSKYLVGMARAGVPVVELGFRLLEPTGFAGATAHTTDAYIEGLEAPESLDLAVMLNAKDLVKFPAGARNAIDKLFQASSYSQVGLVRIATTWSELAALRPATERLAELGYRVGVNLMQVHARSQGELTEFGGWCAESGASVAYFADSFGCLYPTDIAPIVSAIAGGFAGPVGCHLHDNMSLAVANSLAAVDAGVTWVDSTIRGMGRGPGNARTEYLAVELTRRSLIDIDVQHMLELVSGDFADLQDRYGWGTNLYYLLSAVHGVHPTYVQRMTSDPRYSAEDIVSAVERLGRAGGASFSMEQAAEAGSLATSGTPGTWDATDWCEGRSVLIVGPGHSARSRREDLERFIADTRPLVLNLNLVPLVDPALVDAYVVCNPMRAKLDMRHLISDETPVIGPPSVIEMIASWDCGAPTLDFGLQVKPGVFSVEPDGCVVPSGVVAAYALAIARQGGAKQIALVGLDGFDRSDPRQAEMVEVIERFASGPASPPIVALTPTTYPIPASSIYAPEAL